MSSFFLHANIEVIYDGRASSTLERGDYVVIKKPDNSIQILARDQIQPRNYMTKIYLDVDENQIIVKSKSEIIEITVHQIHQLHPIYPWSSHKIKLIKTEAELRDKIADNPKYYLNIDPLQYIMEKEFQINVGAIDLIFFPRIGNIIHVIEVKRKAINISAAYQLKRYIDFLRKSYPVDQNTIIGYLAAPTISNKAINHCKEHQITYIKVNF